MVFVRIPVHLTYHPPSKQAVMTTGVVDMLPGGFVSIKFLRPRTLLNEGLSIDSDDLWLANELENVFALIGVFWACFLS